MITDAFYRFLLHTVSVTFIFLLWRTVGTEVIQCFEMQQLAAKCTYTGSVYDAGRVMNMF